MATPFPKDFFDKVSLAYVQHKRSHAHPWSIVRDEVVDDVLSLPQYLHLKNEFFKAAPDSKRLRSLMQQIWVRVFFCFLFFFFVFFFDVFCSAPEGWMLVQRQGY